MSETRALFDIKFELEEEEEKDDCDGGGMVGEDRPNGISLFISSFGSSLTVVI